MEISVFGRKFFVNKALAVCSIFVLILFAGTLGFFLRQIYHPLETPVVEENPQMAQNKDVITGGEEVQEEKIPEIKVYVTGCVNKPGVVTLKKGQVIDDAIKIAGGATKAADLNNINLAYELNENTMLRIKAKGINTPSNTNKVSANVQTVPQKTANDQKPGQPQQNAKSQNKSLVNSGVDIITDSMGTVLDEESKTAESSGSKLVNINKASQAELEELPSVGPSTAKAIIEFRGKNGGFKQLTDIMKITGIKQKTFDKIKDFICVD